MAGRTVARMLIAALVITASAQAHAQSTTPEWRFTVAPYIWAAGMDGSLRIADREQDVEASFGTILENLDLAFMGHFDARNDRWVLSTDLVFVDLEHDEDLAGGNVTAGLEMTLLDLVGGYRVTPELTLLLGARWVDSRVDLRYTGDHAEPAGAADSDWIDPLLGVHALLPLAERWRLGLYGDIGGFGVGSELAWQASVDLRFDATERLSVVLGYRGLDIDYEKDDTHPTVGLDLLISGPRLGVVFTF